MAGDDAAALVAAALQAMPRGDGKGALDWSFLPAIRAILAAPDDVRRRCIVLAARDEPWESRAGLLASLVREPAGMSAEEIELVLPALGSQFDGNEQVRRVDQLSFLVGQIEVTWAALDDGGKARLLPRLDWTVRVADPWTAARLCQLTIASADDGGEVPYGLIDDASPVGKDLIAVLTASPEPDPAKAGLIRLLAAYPCDGKPRRDWHAHARAVREALRGPAIVSALLDAALNAADYHYQAGYSSVTGPIQDAGWGSVRNEPILCGLTVLAGQLAAAEPGLLPRLRRMALRAITVVSSTGTPPSIRLAGLAAHAIADAALPASITELLKAERGTRHGTLLRQIRRSIDALASAQGLTRDQLLERAVEDHGLGPDGTSRRPLAGSWLAVIQAGPRTATISYEGPDGKPRKSLPPAIKEASADALTVAGADLKALRATIGNERARLDALLATGRSWPAAQWRQLYLDHPVTGQLTRTLIWQLSTSSTGTGTTGFPTGDSALVTSAGIEVPIPADDSAEVRLWHPVHATVARRQYPHAGGQAVLRAEFFFDPADEQDFTYQGMYRYCASDQVRFFDAGTGDPVPLAEVPPLTFSEAMRDVDLFIGVTSIGADPEWLDRGEGRRFEHYWHRWSFGDLTTTAQVRHEVLAGLLPMLAIAGRCELTERFLKVHGDLRTYKIHLGSGNILMTPNDQYLCIVAARDARASKVFLPFDDDPLLSLILSKAFLLANDASITDPAITRQIAAR